MPKLIAHIGTHKTGSTAIQRALIASAPRLGADGLAFVPTPRGVWALETATEYDSEIVETCRGEFLASVDAMPPEATFVISCEAFCGDPKTGYANMPLLARALARITEGFETSIVVYLRSQDSLAESAYTQQIHQGGSGSFDEYIGALGADAFDWARLIDTYSELFDRDGIVVRPYDRTALPERSSIFADFAQVIGASELPEAPGQSEPNRGYTRDALEVARLANPLLDPAERHELRLLLQATSAKAPFERYSLFTHDGRREFLGRYRESNAAIAREFLGKDDGRLWADTPASPADDYQGLSAETAVRVLVEAMAAREGLASAADRPPRPSAGIRGLASRALDRTPRLKSALRRTLRRRGLR